MVRSKRKIERIKPLDAFRLQFKAVFLIFFMNNIVLFLSPLFNLYFCVDLGSEQNPKMMMLSNLGLECNSETTELFRLLVSYPLSIIFGLGVPLYILISVKRARALQQLRNPEFLRNFGYFTIPYNRNMIFFEVFVIFNKICYIVLKNLFVIFIIQNQKTFVILIFSLFLMINLGIHLFTSPYEEKNFLILKRIEQYALKISISNTLTALIYNLVEISEGSVWINWLLASYVFILNFAFFLYLGFRFFDVNQDRLTIFKSRFSKIYYRFSSPPRYKPSSQENLKKTLFN